MDDPCLIFEVEVDPFEAVIEVDVETSTVLEVSPGDPQVILLVEPSPGPPGPPGSGIAVLGEALTGAKNGTNHVFTTANTFVAGSTAVYLNGLREHHYTESVPHTITLDDPPSSTDYVSIDYIVAG